MSRHIFWITLVGGILVSVAGYLPLMVYIPSVVVPGWEGTPPTPQAALGLAALALALLLLTGLAAGWLNGAPTRWSGLGTGALAGLLTALIAEAICGGIAAGLWGARNLVGARSDSGGDPYPVHFLAR